MRNTENFGGEEKISQDHQLRQNDADRKLQPVGIHRAEPQIHRFESGFSLIEMVMVIVILGVLSAVAIPRFVDLQKESRMAKVDALHGAVVAATQIVLSVAKIRGSATSVALNVGNVVDLTNFYPAATASGIIAATTLGDDSSLVIVQGAGEITIKVSPDNASNQNSTTCGVRYVEATISDPPGVTKDSTGC